MVNSVEKLPKIEKRTNALLRIYTMDSGWIQLVELFRWLEVNNVRLEKPLQDHNKWDGHYHALFSYSENEKVMNTYEFVGNIWAAETFRPLIKWTVQQQRDG